MKRVLSEEDKVSRETARMRGDIYYISTAPCSKGHTGNRRVDNSRCRQCEKEYGASYHRARYTKKKYIRAHTLEEEQVREAARQKGERHYFFPRPCSKGHVSKRRVKNTQCVQCHNEGTIRRTKQRFIEKPEWRLYWSARQRAKKRGVEFSITPEDIRSVWPIDNKCPVFGLELEVNTGNKGAQKQSPSLDRVDPSKGYVIGNIAVISSRANMIKSNETDPTLFEAIALWLRRQHGIQS